MPTVRLNSKEFQQTLMGVVEYSLGFIDGIKKGKRVFLRNLGDSTILALQEYIDANARMNPEALHHVYEWYQTGSPSARLYEIHYTISNLGLSMKSSFKQSNTIKDGSNEPFYDKAKIMENGKMVVIKPKRSDVLVFEEDGETIFTKQPVTVNPGGKATDGAFGKIFDEFFSQYFSQSFLRAAGVLQYLENPKIYKKNFAQGVKKGRSYGNKAGYTWIINATPGVDL